MIHSPNQDVGAREQITQYGLQLEQTNQEVLPLDRNDPSSIDRNV